jgi:hypothetical protein
VVVAVVGRAAILTDLVILKFLGYRRRDTALADASIILVIYLAFIFVVVFVRLAFIHVVQATEAIDWLGIRSDYRKTFRRSRGHLLLELLLQLQFLQFGEVIFLELALFIVLLFLKELLVLLFILIRVSGIRQVVEISDHRFSFFRLCVSSIILFTCVYIYFE